MGFQHSETLVMILLLAVSPSLEATKSAILPELVELANDEESYVRLAGLETVVNILSLLDDGKLAFTGNVAI